MRVLGFKSLLHGRTNVFVEYFLVLFVGIAIVVARSDIPEDNGEIFCRHEAWDVLYGFAVSGADDKCRESLNPLCKLVDTVASRGGGTESPTEPIEGGRSFGVEFDWVVVAVQNLGDSGIGEGLAVHLFAVATPRCIEVNEVKLGTDLSLRSILDSMPFYLGLAGMGSRKLDAENQPNENYYF